MYIYFHCFLNVVPFVKHFKFPYLLHQNDTRSGLVTFFWMGTSALFCLCALSEFLNLSISHGTGRVRGSENHLLCRFTGSSGCLSFPGSLLHSGWLPVSLRYHGEEKTAWHGPRSSASQKRNVQRPLLVCCPGLLQCYIDFPARWSGRRYLLQRFDSTVMQQLLVLCWR